MKKRVGSERKGEKEAEGKRARDLMSMPVSSDFPLSLSIDCSHRIPLSSSQPKFSVFNGS